MSMLEQWLFEIIQGIGRMFYNPLLYWAILLLIITGFRRIKRERHDFGTKLYGVFSEIRYTWLTTLVFGLLISMTSIIFGIVLTPEIILVLSIVVLLVSITGSFQFLSAGHTLGITFILLLVLPLLPLDGISSVVNFDNVTTVHLISVAILMGLLLLAEVVLITEKRLRSYPSLVLGNRGIWIGQHELKGMAFIPFFTFVPSEQITFIAPILPYFQFGSHTYSLVLVPFIIGFQYKIRSEIPVLMKQKIGRKKLLVAAIVLITALSSLYFPPLALLAVIIAIFETELFTYRHRRHEKGESPLFMQLKKGIKVLATIPGSRGDQLGILPGETILKVNGKIVSNSSEYYEALQQSGAFVKLSVLDANGEVRFLQSAMYEKDHHELGILFPEAPFKEQYLERMEKIKA